MSVLKQEQESYDPMEAFNYGLKAAESRRQYPRRFKPLLDFIKLEGTLNEQAKSLWLKAKENPKWAEDRLMQFIRFQKERAESGKISQATIPNYYRAAKLFCEMNDIVLNWKKIARGLPRIREATNDRAPTLKEIQKLVEYPDRRIKPIVYTMVSSGIRIGAFDFLKWKHITPVKNEKGDAIAAKIVVYAGDSEEYFSFITTEAYKSLSDWMDFRASYGEKISGDSWVFRDLWQTTNITYGANMGLATYPKKLKSTGIKRIIERALWEQGLRHALAPGQKRHEWKAAHGFRKFYKTRTEQVMKPINVEITMGHNIGLSASYYRPTENEVMEDYLKATDHLTIYGNEDKLSKKPPVPLGLVLQWLYVHSDLCLVPMQSLKHTDQMKEITRYLLEEIQDTQRQIFPDHAPTFNNSLKNKIRLMRQILRLMDRYPTMTATQLLYLIECKIEGENFLLDFAKTIEVTDQHFDNLDNLEWIRFAVRKAGKVKWDD